MGSDANLERVIDVKKDFNPRSPHGERLTMSGKAIGISIFQSTLPAWGATQESQPQIVETNISIHAPRMGSDNVLAE